MNEFFHNVTSLEVNSLDKFLFGGRVLCLSIMQLLQVPDKATRCLNKPLTWQIRTESLRFVFVKELEEESDISYCLYNKHLRIKDSKPVPNWRATT